MRSFFSNTVTSWPARASCCAAARPAGPEPTTATFLPVLIFGGCGTTQPSSQPRSMIACSIDLMPTGIVVDVERARRLARRRADAAGELGEVVGRVQDLERVLPVLPVHQVVEVRNDVVDRAAAVAERHAAVHAARALHLGLLVVQMRGRIRASALARLRRLGGLLQALVLHEAGDFPIDLSSSLLLVRRPRRSGDAGSAAFAREFASVRAPVFVREHLDEARAHSGPVVEELARAQAAGPAVVVFDQFLQQDLVGLAAVPDRAASTVSSCSADGSTCSSDTIAVLQRDANWPSSS